MYIYALKKIREYIYTYIYVAKNRKKTKKLKNIKLLYFEVCIYRFIYSVYIHIDTYIFVYLVSLPLPLIQMFQENMFCKIEDFIYALSIHPYIYIFAYLSIFFSSKLRTYVLCFRTYFGSTLYS